MSKLFDEIMEGSAEALSFMSGNETGCRIHVPAEIDVRRIRGKLRMSQQRFADAFGFSVDAVRHWENGRRCPESAARSLLLVIDHDPATVQSALAAASIKEPVAVRSGALRTRSAKQIRSTAKRSTRKTAAVRTAA